MIIYGINPFVTLSIHVTASVEGRLATVSLTVGALFDGSTGTATFLLLFFPINWKPLAITLVPSTKTYDGWGEATQEWLSLKTALLYFITLQVWVKMMSITLKF
jgi:hypothetical protein